MSKYNIPLQTPIAVAFKQPKKRKTQLKVFTDLRCADPLITNKSKKLPPDSEILDIGVGSKFESIYKKKYKL